VEWTLETADRSITALEWKGLGFLDVLHSSVLHALLFPTQAKSKKHLKYC
jgi:hypothetical protein